jgi:outer membrane protein OmpA-like peptidoglycan-associated protein
MIWGRGAVMRVQRPFSMLLGLGGVVFMPALALADDEPSQSAGASIQDTGPGKTTTITKEGERTRTKVEPGQTTVTKWDAEGKSATKTMKTQATEKTTVVTKTTSRAPVVAKLVPIYFRTDSDKIEPIALPLLDATAAALKGSPGIQVVNVQGHADARGDEAYNLDLTNRRAQSVSQALEERGVAPDRLQSSGEGTSKPICAANDADCWSQNRRVDIIPQSAGSAEPAAPAK